MFITHIDVAGMQVENCESVMRAHVAIMSDSGRVLVDCRIPVETHEPAKRKAALMHEAIRQLRRMPEYRSGQRQILLADGVLA